MLGVGFWIYVLSSGRGPQQAPHTSAGPSPSSRWADASSGPWSLAPGAALHGRVLSSETAVAACVESGATLLIANPRLPVLLAAIRAVANRSAGHPEDI